jgi:hypothetical protein
MSAYEVLAARRFLFYKWMMRKATLDRTIAALTLDLFMNAVPLLEKSGLLRKRSVEKVNVE